MTTTVILDNEAVQALLSVAHPKHARAFASVRAVTARRRNDRPMRLLVPTAVRVEAGLDRTAPAAAFINRLGILDVPLDGAVADVAAALVATHHVSVADAHVGAALRTVAGPVTILTSDPGDMRTVAGTKDVVIVTL